MRPTTLNILIWFCFVFETSFTHFRTDMSEKFIIYKAWQILAALGRIFKGKLCFVVLLPEDGGGWLSFSVLKIHLFAT